MEPADRLVFWDLVGRYEDEPARRSEIEAELYQRFRRTLSILVVDTAGYTRGMTSEGVVPALVRLLRLERMLPFLVEPAGGTLLPREADNFMALLPDPSSALGCCRAILDEIRTQNEGVPPHAELAVSLGIGYGPVLVVGDDGPPFGEEVNLAFKLGEDVAGPNEVWVTEAAARALGEAGETLERLDLTLSGLPVAAYRLVK